MLGQRQVKPGQLVGPGSQITTLTPLPNVWVIANYKETQITHMAVGQRAQITVDTFPGHKLRGHVLAFAPASGAEFALLPPDNATGNFTKVVQRIAVKISIEDADGLADRLIPGMSVEARIDARDGKAMSAATPAVGSGVVAPTLASPPTSVPWLGLLAVLMGTFISTLNGRLSTFGLADIRGALGAGFDEGAWITTAQTTAQMFVTLAAIWMGAAYGPRRVSDRRIDCVRAHLPADAVLDDIAHVPRPAVPGRPGIGLLHSTHVELHPAQHAAATIGHLASRSMR